MKAVIIDLYLAAVWLAALGVIAGVFAGGYKALDVHLFSRKKKLESRVGDIESWNKKQQTDISNITEQNSMMIRGILACLKGQEQQGCNGPVSESIKELEDYLFRRASDTVSSLGGRHG